MGYTAESQDSLQIRGWVAEGRPESDVTVTTPTLNAR
jgi:hypothetical protein